jgi:hypothetical protein
MSGKRVPGLVPVAIVAKVEGWSTDFARGILVGAAVAVKVRGRWYAKRGPFRERLPDVFEDVFAYYELGEHAAQLPT